MMRGEQRKLLYGLVWVLVFAAFTSCGVDGSEAESRFQDAVDTVEPGSNLQGDDVENTEDAEQAKRGGVFRFFTGNRLIPDPAVGKTWRLHAEVYSGLTKVVDNPIVPIEMELAERYSIHDGGLVYEFVLRPDLRFSDGSPLTASDVKWSWERALNPSTRSREALGVLGAIEGAKEISEGLTAELSGVTVVDDRTLRVHLEYPSPAFLAQLSNHEAAVLKQENVEQWEIDWSNPDRHSSTDHSEITLPVGTGPFQISNFNFVDGICVLTRNEHYHGRLAYLDGVEFVTNLIDPDWSTFLDNLLLAYQRDEIDMALVHPSVMQQYRDDPLSIDGTVKFIQYGETVHVLAFNSGLAPYDDVHFRRALVAAADVESMGIGDTAGSILWPGFLGYSEENDVVRHSSEDAKNELSKSVQGGNESSVKLTYHGDLGYFKNGFDSLAEDWRATLGIELKHKLASTSTLEKMYEDGSREMTYMRVSPDYIDPLAVLHVFPEIFGPREGATEYANVSQMLERAAGESDDVLRLELYSDAESYLLDQALVLPIGWTASGESAHIKPWVHGYTVPKYGGSRFHDVWFDDTAPKRTLPLP